MTMKMKTETLVSCERLRDFLKRHGYPTSGDKATLRERVGNAVPLGYERNGDTALVTHCRRITENNAR